MEQLWFLRRRKKTINLRTSQRFYSWINPDRSYRYTSTDSQSMDWEAHLQRALLIQFPNCWPNCPPLKEWWDLVISCSAEDITESWVQFPLPPFVLWLAPFMFFYRAVHRQPGLSWPRDWTPCLQGLRTKIGSVLRAIPRCSQLTRSTCTKQICCARGASPAQEHHVAHLWLTRSSEALVKPSSPLLPWSQQLL